MQSGSSSWGAPQPCVGSSGSDAPKGGDRIVPNPSISECSGASRVRAPRRLRRPRPTLRAPRIGHDGKMRRSDESVTRVFLGSSRLQPSPSRKGSTPKAKVPAYPLLRLGGSKAERPTGLTARLWNGRGTIARPLSRNGAPRRRRARATLGGARTGFAFDRGAPQGRRQPRRWCPVKAPPSSRPPHMARTQLLIRRSATLGGRCASGLWSGLGWLGPRTVLRYRVVTWHCRSLPPTPWVSRLCAATVGE
jgi:hypothetical protein